MRIISGRLKGRRLPPYKSSGTRPTTDFAREALFNLIEHQMNIDQCTFLDLFSGTGAVSFEFISRGAIEGVCIDMSQYSNTYRRKLIELFQIDNLISIRKDVFKYLVKTENKFDIIFADPPYQLKNIESIPELIFENEVLKANGLLVLEHPGSINFQKHPKFIEQRNYSSVHFSFFA